jgi:chromosome segregation ATPase
MIENALSQWQQHFETRKQALQSQSDQCDAEIRHLHEQNTQLALDQSRYEHEQKQLCHDSNLLRDLQERFTLVTDISILERKRSELREQLDILIFRIGQAQSREPKAIQHELQRIEQDLEQLSREMRTQNHNLYQQLAGYLPPAQLVALNKSLAKPVLTLGAECFTLDGTALVAALAQADENTLHLPGLQLRLDALSAQYQQRTPAELEEQQQELLQQQEQLRQQLATAEELESVKQQRRALEEQLAQLDKELNDYSEMQSLRQSEAERQEQLAELKKTLAVLKTKLDQLPERHQELDRQRRQHQQDLSSLEYQHRLIEQRRNQRPDYEGQFTCLAELLHHPWPAQPEFALEQLAERLQTYLSDCRLLLDLDDRVRHLIREIHAGGLTKYQFVGDDESEIQRLVEFAHHLPQEAEALEKKARSAVVNVAACLRELRDGLNTFKSSMRTFNRKISGRRLSDLAVFKIEPEDETQLVEAIELLIRTSETVASGETFELFNQQSVLDDDQLNRAKTLLIEEGNARQGLGVSDLFRLRFWVGKAGS